MPVAAIYSAGVVGWPYTYRHYRENGGKYPFLPQPRSAVAMGVARNAIGSLIVSIAGLFCSCAGDLCPKADASRLPPGLRRGGDAAHAHAERQRRKRRRVRDMEVK